MTPIMASLQSSRVVDVAFKVDCLYRHTCSSGEIGGLSVSDKPFTFMLFFITAPLIYYHNSVAEGLIHSLNQQL